MTMSERIGARGEPIGNPEICLYMIFSKVKYVKSMIRSIAFFNSSMTMPSSNKFLRFSKLFITNFMGTLV